MKGTTSKEKILKKVRNALLNQGTPLVSDHDQDSPVFPPIKDGLDICFVEEFQKVGGTFVYCENHDEFAENFALVAQQNKWENIFCIEEKLSKLLEPSNLKFRSSAEDFLQAKVGITSCECLISRFGSILVSSKSGSGRRLPVYPDVHVVVAFANQFVHDIREAIVRINGRYGAKLPSSVTMITGPSRTADIEKTLVMGAHGPKVVYVFFIDKNQ
ncbi:MAG: lactate utilization protein [Bacteroidetes bacterium]|nr:lactate utilization protein [Bacteroidota bacterium]MBU1717834.1 lactate utilization protein [Bacteroidota bacterium]